MNLTKKRSTLSSAFALIVACLCLGCSNQPTTYPIKGTVRFSDGTPVQFGEIETLQCEMKLNARGTIRKDGSFELSTFGVKDGAVEGKHKVVINQFSAGPLTGNVEFETIEHSHGHEIAKRYRSYGDSPLEFEIIPGKTKEVVLEITDFTPGKTGGH